MIEHNLFEMENYRELIDEVGVESSGNDLRNYRKQQWNLLRLLDFLT